MPSWAGRVLVGLTLGHACDRSRTSPPSVAERDGKPSLTVFLPVIQTVDACERHNRDARSLRVVATSTGVRWAMPWPCGRRRRAMSGAVSTTGIPWLPPSSARRHLAETVSTSGVGPQRSTWRRLAAELESVGIWSDVDHRRPRQRAGHVVEGWAALGPGSACVGEAGMWRPALIGSARRWGVGGRGDRSAPQCRHRVQVVGVAAARPVPSSQGAAPDGG